MSISETNSTDSQSSTVVESRLDRARRVFVEYRSACFWHMRQNLPITEEDIPLIVRGLRTYGDRRAFLEAAILEKGE